MVWLLIGFFAISWSVFVNHKWLPVLVGSLAFAQAFGWQWSMDTLVFVVGVALLALELFIPDFGLAGLLGLVAVNVAVYDLLLNWSNLSQFNIGLMSVVLLVFFLANKLGYSLSLSPALVLNAKLDRENGYQSAKASSVAVGQIGNVFEDLKPVGRVNFQKDIGLQEVISTRGYLKAGQTVIVEKIEGNRVYVKPYFEEGH